MKSEIFVLHHIAGGGGSVRFNVIISLSLYLSLSLSLSLFVLMSLFFRISLNLTVYFL